VIPLTRKNYIRIAEALADTLYKASDSQLDYFNIERACKPWINYLASDNARFDQKRFIDYVWDQYSIAMGYEAIEK